MWKWRYLNILANGRTKKFLECRVVLWSKESRRKHMISYLKSSNRQKILEWMNNTMWFNKSKTAWRCLNKSINFLEPTLRISKTTHWVRSLSLVKTSKRKDSHTKIFRNLYIVMMTKQTLFLSNKKC